MCNLYLTSEFVANLRMCIESKQGICLTLHCLQYIANCTNWLYTPSNGDI